MERVQSNGDWSLFCPSESPGLADCWGEEFEKLYTQYEREVYPILPSWLYFGFVAYHKSFTDYSYCFLQGKAKKVVQAQNLWFEILKSQIETGTPYMLFKVAHLSKTYFSLFSLIP
jgi:ribonucleoside-diphosphate reductase subunit M1